MLGITSPIKPLGIGIAGLGFGEKVHLPALIANKHLAPIALWHPRQDRLDNACNLHGLTGYQDWRNMLDNPKIIPFTNFW